MNDSCNAFDNIKNQFIDMLIDIKDFSAVSIRNKLFIDYAISLIQTFDSKVFFEKMKNFINISIPNEINKKNYNEIICNLIKELKNIEKDQLKFLTELNDEEIKIIINHLSILVTYSINTSNY